MLKIGITGGIGSGKTTVCKIFELQGIPVFYADQQAKTIMHTDALLIEKLKEAFGEDIYSAQGELNRSALASLVFNDQTQLTILNDLVHPAVFRAFDAWIDKQRAPYVLKEAALLFESESYKKCDFTILLKSPHELKVSRIIQRDSISEGDVLKRMSKQMNDIEKEALADFIILNDEQQLLIPQLIELHPHFLNSSFKG